MAQLGSSNTEVGDEVTCKLCLLFFLLSLLTFRPCLFFCFFLSVLLFKQLNVAGFEKQLNRNLDKFMQTVENGAQLYDMLGAVLLEESLNAVTAMSEEAESESVTVADIKEALLVFEQERERKKKEKEKKKKKEKKQKEKGQGEK